jgi:hypothetical protein
MPDDSNYIGGLAENLVIRAFLEAEYPPFVSLVDCPVDIIGLCENFHPIRVQVKMAYKGESFHAGEYNEKVDYYAVVAYTDEYVDSYIYWIPPAYVTAESHAKLTDELKLFEADLPPCPQCERIEELYNERG